MVDKLKKCLVVGDGINVSLKFDSSSGIKKTINIDHRDIPKLIIELQNASIQSHAKRENNAIQSNKSGADAFFTPMEVSQYQFAFSSDNSHLVLQFRTKDQMTIGFPMAPDYAKQMGERLIEHAEKLVAGHKPGSFGGIH